MIAFYLIVRNIEFIRVTPPDLEGRQSEVILLPFQGF
jgi:hypothetical protein